MKKIYVALIALMIAVSAAIAAHAEQTPRLLGGSDMSHAAMMFDGQLIQSELNADDVSTQCQWYGFRATDSGLFCRFTVENLGSTGHAQGFDFKVCDKDGKVLCEQSVESGKTRDFSVKIDAGEMVYARIYGYYEGVTGLYRVRFDQVEDPEGDNGVVPVSGTVYSINVKEDCDAFVYPTGELKSYVHLDCTNISCDGDWFIAVHDIDGVKIDEMRVYGKSGVGSMIIPMEPNNLYTLTVWTGSVSGNYKLEYAVFEDPHGDTPETAAPLSADGKHAFAIEGPGDRDCFSIAVEDACAYQNLRFENVGADELWLSVCDRYSQVIAQTSLQRGRTADVTFKAPAADTYFIQITGEGFSAHWGDYNLEYAVLPDAQGDDPDTALTVEPGKVNEYTFDAANDVDCLKVEGGAADRATGVLLDTQADGVNARITAYDAYGREIAAQQSCSAGQLCFSVPQPAGEAVYLAVTSETTGRYLLQVCTEETHQPGGEWAIVEPASCAEAGRRVRCCTICGAEVEAEVIPAGQHVPGDWRITAEATCTEVGQRVSDCALCGALAAVEEIPALGHSAGNWVVELEVTCATDGIQSLICDTCGMVVARERIPSVGHVLAEEVTVLQEANCEHDGLEGRLCVVCNQYCEQVTVPGGPHVPGEKLTVNGVPSAICDQCGTIYPLDGE